MAENEVNNPEMESAENQPGIDINADENQHGTTHLSEPLESEPELEKLRTELQESKERYLRLAAEFDNYRRRTSKERVELIQTAGKEIISELLPVLDDWDRAEKQFANDVEAGAFREGISLIFHKLKNTLQARGLKPMEAAGKEFDAELHEAITQIDAPTPDLQGKVVDEVEKGYYLGEKIIRHAKVVVGK